MRSSTVTANAIAQAVSRGSRARDIVRSTRRAKRVAVRGERMVPPSIAAMPISGQKPRRRQRGVMRPSRAPRAATHDQQRSEDAARGARTERDGPDDRLDEDEHQRSRGCHAARAAAAAMIVVPDAERAGLDEPAQADHEPTERRPPHPMDGQALESVLGTHRRLVSRPDQHARHEADAGGSPAVPTTAATPPRRRERAAPAPKAGGAQAAATTQATATGMKLRGFHSNNSSSTASSTAATGVPKMPHARRSPGHQQGLALGGAQRESIERRESRSRRRS